MTGEPLVSGEIEFESPPDFTAGSVVHVKLLDTSLADAPALVVAEQVLADCAQRAAGKNLPFALDGELKDPRASYCVSVHADLDGDGRISSGDFITMQSYPVLTHGYPQRVLVKVRRIP